MNVKFHKIILDLSNKFKKFTYVLAILVEFDIHFLGLPWRIFSGVIADDQLHL